jgi:hypothetical protein
MSILFDAPMLRTVIGKMFAVTSFIVTVNVSVVINVTVTVKILSRLTIIAPKQIAPLLFVTAVTINADAGWINTTIVPLGLIENTGLSLLNHEPESISLRESLPY